MVGGQQVGFAIPRIRHRGVVCVSITNESESWKKVLHAAPFTLASATLACPAQSFRANERPRLKAARAPNTHKHSGQARNTSLVSTVLKEASSILPSPLGTATTAKLETRENKCLCTAQSPFLLGHSSVSFLKGMLQRHQMPPIMKYRSSRKPP